MLTFCRTKMSDAKTPFEIKLNAVEVAKKHGDRHQEAKANLDLAHAYRDQENPQKAILCYQQAQIIFHARTDKRWEGEAYLGLGKSLSQHWSISNSN